ncbi:unnamed protein product [Phytophthora fragariaefolia]|uniref:Unnamed protein product n=1 Tax=Phytophthora fragariaefolia TaxID=1490495 RepID=A0A9W7CI33_9STRA|nr:unnamed protein product [Phytophthora fragariaefolia]
MTVAAGGGLDVPAAGSRRKPHQPPDQPYSIPLLADEGHEEVMDLLASDDLGAVLDGELLRMSALSSKRRRPRPSRRSVGSRSTTVVSRPASPASDDVFPDFEAGSPAEDVEFDPLTDDALAFASPLSEVPVPGSLDSSMTTATSGPVVATSSTAVTTVVSAAPTLDPAVVGGSSPCEFTTGLAISNSAATAPGSASPVQASVSIPAGSMVSIRRFGASVITSDSTRAATSASSMTTTHSPSSSVATVAPMLDPAQSVVATSGSAALLELTASPATSSISALDSADIAGVASSSAEVSASTPDSAGTFVATVTSAGVSATTPDSAGASTSTPDAAGASTSTPDAAGVSATTPVSAAPAPTASDSIVTDVVTSSSVAPATSVSDPSVPAAPAVLRLLACPRRQSAHQSPDDSASRVLTAGSGVSSTSTQSAVPTPGQGMVSPSGRPRRASAINAARLSSHYLGELKVSDHVALGFGDSAGSSPDSAAHVEGSSAQPLELSGGSSEGEPEGTVVSSPGSTSGREQLGHRDGSVVSGPKARAPASSAPASDGEVSSQDSDDIPIRDGVSRMQTGRKTPRGKYQSYLLLGRTPPSSPPASEPTRAEAVQRPRSSLLGKKKRQPERPTSERDSKHKHKHKRKHKHKHRESARAGHASSADDRGSSKKHKRSAPPDSTDGSRSPKKSRRTRSSLSYSSPRRLDWFSSGGGYSHFQPPSGCALSSGTSCIYQSAFQHFADSISSSGFKGFQDHPSERSVAQAEVPSLCFVSLLENDLGAPDWADRTSCEGRPRIPPTPCSLAGLRAFAGVYNPRHPAQWLRKLLPGDPVFCSLLAFSQARTRLANSARSPTLIEKLAEVWIKLRGEIPNSADSGHSTSLARDDHSTRYFVALWGRTHWIAESSVMMGLHPRQQASSSYEEIAEMYAEWSKYKLNRKRRSDALRGLMISISDNLFSAVMKVVDGVPAPDVDAEVYFEPSVPVYPLVNLSWIPGGADWSRAATEVDAVEPWRTWWLTDPASHPYNTCVRARNVDFLPFAPAGMESHVVEAAVVDDVDLTESDPPIRSFSVLLCANRSVVHIFEGCGPGELGWSASNSAATARHARATQDDHGESPSDSRFGSDSWSPGPNEPADRGLADSAGHASPDRASASRSPRDIDSAMDLLASAASSVTLAATPPGSDSPVTL